MRQWSSAKRLPGCADARRYAGNLTDEQRREVLADLAAAAAAIREASEVIAAAGTPGPAPSR